MAILFYAKEPGIGGIDSYTKLMLHMDGSEGGTTFTDSSGENHSFSATGNAATRQANKKYGTAALDVAAGANYIESASHADYGMGTGDYTIDYWLRLDSYPDTYGGIWSIGQGFLGNGTPHKQECWYYDSDFLIWRANRNGGGGGSPEFDLTVPFTLAGGWHHIAHVRQGNDFRFFVNGVMGTEATGKAMDFGADRLRLGYDEYGPGTDMDGQIDEFRISKGIARWWSNFTPPTGPYTT